MSQPINTTAKEKAPDFQVQAYKLRTKTTIFDQSGNPFTISELDAEKLVETKEWFRVKPLTEAEKTNNEIRGLRSDFAQFTSKNDEQSKTGE